MGYKYDIFGWYIGQGTGERSTETAPDNQALTEVEEELRSNWTGHKWIELPYRHFNFEETQEPELVPDVITRRQAKQQLLLVGLLDVVDVGIAAIEDETERRMAQIYWEDSQEFERNHPLLISLGMSILGLTEEQLDDLFIAASKL
ncbi:MAG: hypothetical protein RBR82_06250 [Pseudomonas sp.]|nr:hypothetical protein [Pseudomonas sp.]